MKKTYKLNVNGKDYTVKIADPNASPLEVVVNGKPFKVTLAEQETTAAAPIVLPIEDEEYEAYVPDVASTFVAEIPQVAEVEDVIPVATSAHSGNLTQVVAPMPGKVLDIVTKVGDKVKHGDTLCNLEAMKMKSPIRSTADGTVAQVLVSEGQNVNYNDPLFALE